jgi:hypothetical protein
MYLILSNDDSKTYYSQNNASHFRVKLGQPLTLDGEWSVGVCEIHLSANADLGRLGFHSDICNGLFSNGIQTDLLRKINCKTNVHETFPIVYYLHVEKLFIDTLEFYLTKADGSIPSLDANVKLECTLHFRKHV